MKKNLLSAIALASLFSGQLFYAQQTTKILNDKSGKPYFIEFSSSSVTKTSVNEDQLFRDILQISPDSKMVKTQSGELFSKFSDDKFQLYHNNIKVEFATYTLHYNQGKLTSMSGETYDTEGLTKATKISEQQALQKALTFKNVEKLMTGTDELQGTNYASPKAELVYFPVLLDDDSHRLVLAYKFDIYAEAPLLRSYIYVDANSGKILMDNPIMKHVGEIAKHQKPDLIGPYLNYTNESKPSEIPLLVAGNAATRYSGTKVIETTLSGSSYILRETTRGSGVHTYNNGKSTSLKTTNFTDANNDWTAAEFNNTNYDNAALDAHWGVEKTYDYFKSKFNRNSYNNSGALLKSHVHYGSSYENAGWTGSEMIYGDGASTFRPLTAFDVTAHELGHAVCEYTANLVYSRESGAINEGLSDIWGAAVEYEYAPSKQAFIIGEDITKVSPYNLRNMSNPNAGLSAQPDTYGGTYWKAATSSCTPTQTNDYCGVHYNSGVLNYWFYLLVSGGSGTNDLGNSFNVTGIGFQKAAQIVYRLESSYLSSNSTYSTVLTYAIQSAKELFGDGSAEHAATQNALYAVGLGTPFAGSADTTAPSAPANLAASSTTTTSTNLSWSASTDNVGVTGYYVYRGSTLLATVTATNYSVTGLSAGTNYTFTVQARDAAGNVSASSNSVSVTTATAPTADTTAPSVPTNLAASGTTTSSTNLSWTASTDNVAVTGYSVYQGTTLLGTTSSTSYAVSGLSAATAYTFSVRASDAAGNTSAYSTAVSVTTLTGTTPTTPPTGYCTSKGNNANYEWIAKVVFSGINKSSTTKTGYEDFTSTTTTVNKGTAYTISITPGFSSGSYSEGYAVFIDYNRDGDFSDAGETVLTKTTSYTSPQTGTITIPTTAASGATRMRVSMKYNGTPTACETFSYGQVEDYIITISGTGLVGLTPSDVVAKTSIYPNPVQDVLNIKSASEGEYNYKIYSADGKLASSGKSSGKSIAVGQLGAGMYIITIDNGKEKFTEKLIKK